MILRRIGVFTANLLYLWRYIQILGRSYAGIFAHTGSRKRKEPKPSKCKSLESNRLRIISTMALIGTAFASHSQAEATFLFVCFLSSKRVVGQGFCPVPPEWAGNLCPQVGAQGGKKPRSPLTLHLKTAMRGGICIVESDCEWKPELSLGPDQKKSLWQKIKEFFTQEPGGKGSEYWRNRDLENW